MFCSPTFPSIASKVGYTVFKGTPAAGNIFEGETVLLLPTCGGWGTVDGHHPLRTSWISETLCPPRLSITL